MYALRANADKGNFSALLTAKIPEGVTKFNQYTLFSDSLVQEIELPTTLTTLGQEFATNNTNLRKINLPSGLTSIPDKAFQGCTALTEVDFSQATNITSIGSYAFRSANLSETNVLISEKCTSIGAYAFKASSVKSVVIPSSVATMGIEVFRDCASLTEVTCEVENIPNQTFYDCNALSKITLKNTITIGEQAFYASSGKTIPVNNIELPEGLVSIGKFAFIRCQLTSVIVPSTVTTFGNGAFQTCASLKKAVVLGSSMGADMFYADSALQELVITDKLTTINSGALNGVSSTSFTIYYTGSDYEAIKTLGKASGNGSTRFTDAKYYSYQDYKSDNYTTNKYLFIYDCNICEVAYDSVHLPASAMHEHTSYTASSYLVTGCPRCLEESSRVEVAPIFDGFGYSARIEKDTDTKRALVFSYFINTDSLDIYKSYNPESTLSFGIVGAFESKITNESSEVYNPLNADGTAVQGNVVAYDIASKDIVSIDFIIKGEQATWEANGIPSSPIYMLGYVIDDTGLYYIGNNTEKVTTQSATITDLRTITYNELFTE